MSAMIAAGEEESRKQREETESELGIQNRQMEMDGEGMLKAQHLYMLLQDHNLNRTNPWRKASQKKVLSKTVAIRASPSFQVHPGLQSITMETPSQGHNDVLFKADSRIAVYHVKLIAKTVKHQQPHSPIALPAPGADAR